MHPIIQAEVDEFRKMDDKAFEKFQLNGVYDSLTYEQFLIAALHRAVESAGKEMVGGRLDGSGVVEELYNEGYNSHCFFALSKLDTIINFKE